MLQLHSLPVLRGVILVQNDITAGIGGVDLLVVAPAVGSYVGDGLRGAAGALGVAEVYLEPGGRASDVYSGGWDFEGVNFA